VFRFFLKWSKIQFALTHYTVCEDVGTLSVDILRIGSPDQEVSVDVRAKQQSAKNRLDFIVKSNVTATFPPGTTSSAYVCDEAKRMNE